MRKKFTTEEKLNAVHAYLDGTTSQKKLAKNLGTSQAVVQRWLANYQSMGEAAFYKKGNSSYSARLKFSAVQDYLSGKGSLREICKKYRIKSETQLQRWILRYNGHGELKASGTGGAIIMTKGRKTSFEERVEIVQYCISHNRNYAETAVKYNVSYQQARSYTVKYEAGGVEALRDRRGRTKPEEEMSELEKLRAEKRRHVNRAAQTRLQHTGWNRELIYRRLYYSSQSHGHKNHDSPSAASKGPSGKVTGEHRGRCRIRK